MVDQETGTLVPYDPKRADDPSYVAAFEAAFADQLNALTRDPERARQMGLAGRRRCIEEFSWEKIARETIGVYEKAIAFHKGR